jgi:hypothetical protein
MFLCRPVEEIYDGCIITLSLKIWNQYVSATQRMETADSTKTKQQLFTFLLVSCSSPARMNSSKIR